MNCQFVLLFASLMSICATYDIHKFMTADEIKSTFHVDRHDLVPEYEVVHIHHNVRRSISRDIPSDTENSIDTDEKPKYEDRKTELKLKVFGKHLNLTLIPNRGLYKKNKLKIWTVEPNATAQHGVEYVELPETDEDIGDIYQDEENQAAILLRNHNDTVIVEGSIGADLVIRPIPPRLLDAKDKPTHDDDEMFLDADGELSSEVAIDTGLPIKRKKQKIQGHRHIVYKRNGNHEDTMSDYALMEPDHLAKRHKRSTSRKKREAPYTIYPEILVIVDYDGYRLHGGDNLQIKRYFVSFWNGVDMRYKLLKGPKIRISIAGIIISRGRDATPYLERNRVGRDAIDSAAALTDMGKYLFRERRLPVYDIAVAITKYDMCRRRKGGRCTKGTAGFAYVGGACVVNKRLEKVNSVAIIEDTGGFSGIIVAAHEVGHLLGAVHDGSPPPSYLGGPGAEKCQWTDGYIMSDLRHTERGFRWSPCSVSSFHHFLNGDTATCLYNVPHEDDSLPRVLPGKLLTLDAQCRRDRGTSACFKDDRVCAQLFCFDASSGYCVAYRPAAEGSPCGDGQYCLNGRCVAEHENIIPDYTQNTPSYIRSGNNQGRPLFHEDDEEVNQRPETPKYYDYTTPPYNPNPPSYNPYTTPRQFYQFSTTKSPYDFNDFARQYTSKNPYQTTESYYSQTTPNPYVGNYYQLRLQTTKNPYDFANFGRNNYDINNNYLKRSYNTANYYSDSSNVRNKSAVFNRGR
ncbi:A disintegrin and metalloproteinase with thrombospondin motifs like isoform X2 [Tribolium castaneum]|uniref:A disintegrin and metalloproteinase with thrombospondin motifs like isoform X2 n=1 Tax=Tribolium castaneum TaxID=7070 RepID=UPI00046C32BD|nr:PREDICTED: venom metalloproteinase 3 isoform X2 [Tribolium castaneum]|eukprot:XP_008195683.1 PREDICTED: venom metalloproteinase 3 isoform X2 [Tribolium castaneum]